MLQVLPNLYQQIVQRTYLLIWFVVGLLGLATLYVRFKVIFLVNPDVGGIENNVIYGVLRILAKYPLYQNPEEAPYAITQYSPIYYYLTAGLSYLAGFTANDVYEVYAVSRCISLIANGFYTWGIIRLARQLQLPASVSILVGILAFTLLPPQAYGRPDSLSTALAIWTIWALLRWNVADSVNVLNYGSALTALLAATALFSKQSAVSLPIIVSSYLIFLNRKPRQIITFLGWFSLFVSLFYISLFGQEASLVYANVIRGVSNGIDLSNFRYNLVDHYLRPFVWLVIPALAISSRYILFEQRAGQLIGLATLIFFGFALITGLKLGSALNYFTEFNGLACVLITNVLWQLRTMQSKWGDVGRLGLVLCIFWVVPVNAMNFNWQRTFGKPIDMTQYRQEQVVARFAKNELQKCQNCLVYSSVYNSSYLNSLLFRNCSVPQQEIILESAYPRKLFDYTDLNQAAQDGRIQFVITRNGETEVPLSPPIHLANYQPIKSLEGYTVYKFKASSN